MWHEVRLLLIALQFLTRVPIPARLGFDPAWLHQSARHFPAVGALVGAWGALVLWGAVHHWSALVAVLLSLAATVWMTGAFHEDGLADTCDALGGSVSREKALAILKDSRLGTYGTLGLVLVLALKVAVLHALVLREFVLALALLPLAHAWSRAGTVFLLRWLPYGGDPDHAKAKPMAQQVDGRAVVVVVAWVALFGAAAAPFVPMHALLAALVLQVLVLWAVGQWLMRRLGGYTGDGLGAAQQFGELAIYLAVAAALVQG